MKDTMELLSQLDSVYERTPEAFHSRVQTTLAKLNQPSAPPRRAGHIRRMAIAAAALVLFSAIAAAANSHQIIAYLTNTMAKNRVLPEAESLLHHNAGSAALGDCRATVSEWLCDGQMLYVAIQLTDPVLAQTEDVTVYSEGLNHYAMYHGPGTVQLSQGHAAGAGWAFQRADATRDQILYTLETSIADYSGAFRVSIPVVCSAGTLEVHFDVSPNNFGRVRTFEPSAVLQAEGYTAQMTQCSATSLHTYAALELRFEESVPPQRRQAIAAAYGEGAGIPEGAGEDEAILLTRSILWSKDGLVCTLELRGNPFETYPETIYYCPRPGTAHPDGDRPPLSLDGAVVLHMKEVFK